MTTLTENEREELEMLRKSAYKFIQSPLDRAFYELQALVERNKPNRLDSVMPPNHFYVLARALLELKRELIK